MNHINNDNDHILIRKSQNTLIVVGMGTMLFSVWTVVKTLSSFLLLKDESVAVVKRTAGESGAALSDKLVFYVVLAGMVIAMILFLAARAFVGMSAISEGRGLRRRNGYLILASIMIILNTASFVTSFFSTKDSQEPLSVFSNNTSLSALIIELTSLIMLVELVYSAIRIRGVRKRVRQSTAQKEQE